MELPGQFSQNGIIKIIRKGITKTVVPKSLISKVLNSFHDEKSHPGQNVTLKTISQYFYWPQLQKDVQDYVKSCHICQLIKPSHHPSFGQLKPIETPSKPLGLIALDTIVMGSTANQTKPKYIQLIIDHHSRYVWAHATSKNF